MSVLWIYGYGSLGGKTMSGLNCSVCGKWVGKDGFTEAKGSVRAAGIAGHKPDDRAIRKRTQAGMGRMGKRTTRNNADGDMNMKTEILEQDRTMVTTTQNKYLLQLATGPKTTTDFMREFMVSIPAAAKMLAVIREKGLLTSKRKKGTVGNVKIHTLTAPYDELNIIIGTNSKGAKITEEEILYAAILRNAGLTGQRLTTQFIKVFQNRNKHTVIKHIVIKARRAGLCR
jgi:hypothetical protein